MNTLGQTDPLFVRCVKPNSTLVANALDGSYVMRQLREMGMVHVVKARKQGFAHRYPFDKFVSRYAYLLRGREGDACARVCAPYYAQHMGSATPPEGEKKLCVTILGVMVSERVLAADGWAVGTAKVFLKESQQQELDVAREAYMVKLVTEKLQAALGARDIELLESAIAAALEVQLHSSELFSQARKLLALLHAQREAAAKLADAIQQFKSQGVDLTNIDTSGTDRSAERDELAK